MNELQLLYEVLKEDKETLEEQVSMVYSYLAGLDNTSLIFYAYVGLMEAMSVKQKLDALNTLAKKLQESVSKIGDINTGGPTKT